MVRDWVGIFGGVGLAMILFWVGESLDRGIGIPDAHRLLTILVLTAGFVLTTVRMQRARAEAYQGRLRFFHQVSHQLRTPVTSIIAYADILSDRPPEDLATRQRFLNILATEARSLAGLVDDVLVLGRLDPAVPQREWRPVDLRQLARAAIDELAPVAAAQTVTVSTVLDPATPPIVGDEDLLRQIFSNLIDNAIKYNRPHGRVRVGLRRERDVVLLTVSDTGRGIPREHRARIFEEFYREHQPDGVRRRGFGLGLDIVRRIAKLHDGSVEVQSEPGQGSIFTVRLPLEPATVRQIEPGHTARWRWLAVAATGSRPLADSHFESWSKVG